MPQNQRGMHPVYAFEYRRALSSVIDAQAGVMTRQVQEDTADSVTKEGDRIQMRRRLGRSDLRSVAEVRGALRELLNGRGRTEHSEVAELLTSEIVTNALVHTDEDAVVTATVGAHRLRVEVRDQLTHRPRLRVPNADDGTHGRGLVLVQALADAWGVRTLRGGKVVWFELAV